MTIPTKTALGQEELKSRAQRLGQRHRTILLLVDGRRPLSEVLSLAQQAGAATSHFEDLVRLGLVDMPPEPEPEPPAPQPDPAADEAPQVTEVRLDVPVPTPAVDGVVAPGEPAPEAAVATAEPEVPTVTPAAPQAVPARAREVPVLAKEAEVDGLQPVRNLLIETLRIDAPLFSARMFMRVRNARSTTDLIDLVWEIQEHLTRTRHAQRELQSLQRARELLGLGNTLVAEDSTKPPLDE
jgi:hypothetical protein